jgi:hypothetical protein
VRVSELQMYELQAKDFVTKVPLAVSGQGVSEEGEMKAEALREIAEDYLYLARDKDGKADTLRQRRYKRLCALAKTLPKRPRKDGTKKK